MKTSTLFTMLAAVALCLFLPQESQAQLARTNSYSDISFDDSTGMINAYGYTQPDYSTSLYYYKAGVQSKIVDSAGNQLALVKREAGGSTVDVTAQVEANADEEYTILSGHYLFASYYKYNYYYNGYYQSGYSDYYNYSYYEGQSTGDFFRYTFNAYGPEIIRYNINVTLGQTKKKVKVGTPHHLKIISDKTTVESCGSRRRFIKFRVVDQNGRGVGHSYTEETFEDLNNPAIKYSSIYNSCQNSSYSPPACSRDADGTFTDQLWVGCPSNGGDCGFPEVRSVWSWCPPNRPKVVLSRNTYYIRHSVVFVNGIQEYDPGIQLYP